MFLKVCNVDRFFKSSSREFHSLIEEGIHYFCKILVLLKLTDIFLLFLRGCFEISLAKVGSKSCKKGTIPLFTLYMKESLCCCLLFDEVVYPHSLNKFSNDTYLYLRNKETQQTKI